MSDQIQTILYAVFVVISIIIMIVCVADYFAQRRRAELTRELLDALPWADPVKLFTYAEYAPLVIKERKNRND